MGHHPQRHPRLARQLRRVRGRPQPARDRRPPLLTRPPPHATLVAAARRFLVGGGWLTLRLAFAHVHQGSLFLGPKESGQYHELILHVRARSHEGLPYARVVADGWQRSCLEARRAGPAQVTCNLLAFPSCRSYLASRAGVLESLVSALTVRRMGGGAGQ